MKAKRDQEGLVPWAFYQVTLVYKQRETVLFQSQKLPNEVIDNFAGKLIIAHFNSMHNWQLECDVKGRADERMK